MKKLINVYKNKEFNISQINGPITLFYSITVLESYRRVSFCEIRRNKAQTFGLFDIIETIEGQKPRPRIRITGEGRPEVIEGKRDDVYSVWQDLRTQMITQDEKEQAKKVLEQEREGEAQRLQREREKKLTSLVSRQEGIKNNLGKLLKGKDPLVLIRGGEVKELCDEYNSIDLVRKLI